MRERQQKIKSTLNKWITILLLGVLFACKNDVEEVVKLTSGDDLPLQSAREIQVLYSSKGNVVFQLNAPLLNQYGGEKPYNEMPEGVEVQILDSTKKVTTRLTANYAIDSTYIEKMEARNNVVVVNDKGEKLETEQLTWNIRTEQITSDEFVKITTADQIIMGTGLISNQDFSEYRIIKPTGTINIDND